MIIHHSPNPAPRRRAFTLIELLVVIVIIGLLLGLLTVAFSGALSKSKNVATENLLRNIQTGVQQFENDFNYLPPLIDGHKHAMEASDDPAKELRLHRYYSAYSLPLYLLGVGELAPDNGTSAAQDPNRHDGHEGPGFRDPGPDRSWGGARERDTDTHRPTTTGRIYGPYIDVGDGSDVLRKAEARDFTVAPDSGIDDFFADENDDGVGDLYVFQDRWGSAIRYYKGWPTREEINGTVQSSLRRVPIELRKPESIEQHMYAPHSVFGADPMLDQEILRAPYALLSAGADGDFGEADEDGEWIDEKNFFMDVGPAFPEKKQAVLKRIRDNIRVTP